MFEALIAIALGMCVSAAVPTVGKWKDNARLITISPKTNTVLLSV